MSFTPIADARGLQLSGIDVEGAELYDSLINDSYYYLAWRQTIPGANWRNSAPHL